ncbi:hypothetical protein GRF91_003141 [Salmonella enterica]|nr:hypothetical protein [Salmonella enterica]
MTTITKEWLQQTIAEFENTRDDIPFGLSDDDAKVLIVLKRALVSLDAEPVRYLNKFSGTCVTLEQQSNAADDVAVYMPLYAAPPVPVQVDIEMLASALKNAPLAPSDNQGRPRAPVVPPAIDPDYKVIKSILPTTNPDEYACCIADDMWNACRAAILQGGEQPQNARQNIPDGNSPAIPDGYALVPVEPTDEMIAAAMECDDVVFDSKDPTAFCVQFLEIYCAMVTAAPKPEVNSEYN